MTKHISRTIVDIVVIAAVSTLFFVVPFQSLSVLSQDSFGDSGAVTLFQIASHGLGMQTYLVPSPRPVSLLALTIFLPLLVYLTLLKPQSILLRIMRPVLGILLSIGTMFFCALISMHWVVLLVAFGEPDAYPIATVWGYVACVWMAFWTVRSFSSIFPLRSEHEKR
ncbi:MAG: hypothetical protein ABL890_02475 [Candidatus Peribacteraceae bacterium]